MRARRPSASAGAATASLFALVAWLAAATAAVPAAAAEPSAEVLAPAAAAMDALEYDAAAAILEELTARTDLPARDRAKAFELLGTCRVYLGTVDAARSAFAELARRDPGWTLPAAYPPRVRVVFDEAVVAASPPVAVAPELAESPAGGPPGAIAVRLAGAADAVDAVRAVVALPDGSTARVVLEPRDGTFAGALPLASFPPGATLRYRVEALAPSGFVLGRLGSDEAPLSLVVPALATPPGPAGPLVVVEPPSSLPGGDGGAETPWYETWWFWTIVGVVVAGGATTAAVLAVEASGPRSAAGGDWVIW